MRTRFLVLALACAPLAAGQETTKPQETARDRIGQLLRKLVDDRSIRCSTTSENVMYAQRLKLAAGRGIAARTARTNPTRMWSARTEHASVWWTEPVTKPKEGEQKQEPHVLVQRGNRWLMKAPGGTWTECRRPNAAWQALYLPDAAFLGRALLQLPRDKWKSGAENIDEKLVRVYTYEGDDAQTKRLIEAGVVPDASDYFSGLASVSRGYIGRNIRRPAKQCRLRMYVDPKTKSATRIVIDVYQENARMATVALRAVGGRPAPVPPGRGRAKDAKKSGKKQPSLTTEIRFVRREGAPIDVLDDAAKALLQKR